MLKAKEWLALIAGLGTCVLTMQLGHWQASRGREKAVLEARMRVQESLPPLRIRESLTALPADPHYRLIQVRGRWLFDQSIYLDNRPLQGKVGYQVVTPLQLPSGERILVDRGWVEKTQQGEASSLPRLVEIPSEGEVEGQAVPTLGRFWEFSSTQPKTLGTVWNNVSLADYRAVSGGVALAPFFLLQTSFTADGLVREWSRPASQVSKHRGYAFQWYALAALSAVLTLYFGWKRVFKRS